MHPYMIKNLYPASQWNDATPTGSGRVAAMVYGKLAEERILLNHEGFWYHGKSQSLPDVADHLSEMRRLMLAGRYQEAEPYLSEQIRKKGYDAAVSSYMPGFDLLIRTDTGGAFSHYERTLDMSTGEIQVRWQIGCTAFRRRVFVSRADNDMAIVRLEADHGGQIHCRLALEPHNLLDAYHYGGASFEVDNRYTRQAQGNLLTILAETAQGGRFSAASRVYTRGGTIKAHDTELVVEGADSVVIHTVLMPHPDLQEAIRSLNALQGDYDTLLARHIQVHSPAFLRSSVCLTREEDDQRKKSNEELLLEGYSSRPATALVERMYHFSRFLLLCSSRPGGLPAGLQGIWNGDYEPPWCGGFFYNENIQLSYWQALPCNEADTLIPLFDLLEKQLPDFRENARRLYGCRGIFVPLYGDAASGILRDLQPQVLYWTAGAGWLARHFYDYYLYTGDLDFLRFRAVPFMKEAALFYEDFFLTGEDGYLLSVPADSPENWANGDFEGAGHTAVCINPTMDFAVAKDLLTNLCAACALLDIEKEQRAIWETMLTKIPPYRINPDGALQEWMHPDFLDNYHHRHQSHIYPAFPGLEITKETHPALYNACRVAVEKRLCIGLGEQTGWSFAHMANIFGRLEEGERALECLEYLLRSCTGPNLFTYVNDWRDMGISMQMIWGIKPPMQLDAAFGYAGAVAEMLLFSTTSLVRILPALPCSWRYGHFKHFRTRNRLDISASWDLDAGTLAVDFTADESAVFTIELPNGSQPTESTAALGPSPLGPRYWQVTAPAGMPCHIIGRFMGEDTI